MNLFELWMDPMFFIHLIFTLLGTAGFFWCIMLFKQACDIEQKRKLSGRFSKSKKEEREEPEKDEDNEEEDLPDEEKEDPYYKPYSQYGYGEDSIGEDQEIEEDRNEEENSDQEYSIPETGRYNGENSGVSEQEEPSYEDENESGEEDYTPEEEETKIPEAAAARTEDYEKVKKRLETAEKNLSAASKGFREMAYRLTELEKALRNIPEPAPVEKTVFAESVNSTFKEIKNQISEMRRNTENRQNENAINELKQKLDNVSAQMSEIKENSNSDAGNDEKISIVMEKLEQIEKKAANAETKDSEETENLRKELAMLKEKNEKLSETLNAMEKKHSELETALKDRIENVSDSVKKEIENIPKPQAVERNETFKLIQSNIQAIKENIAGLPKPQKPEESEIIKNLQAEMEAVKQGIKNLPKPKPIEENDSFKNTLSLIEKTQKDAGSINARLSQIEDKLAGNLASKDYAIKMIAAMLGNIDNMSKEELRIELRHLEDDLLESYKEDLDTDDEDDEEEE